MRLVHPADAWHQFTGSHGSPFYCQSSKERSQERCLRVPPTRPCAIRNSAIQKSIKKGRLAAALQSLQTASTSSLPSEWREHQKARRIRQRAHYVKRSASAIGLLQRPVAHVQLQPKQNAVVGDLCTEGVP
jgi:hypothetical protein